MEGRFEVDCATRSATDGSMLGSCRWKKQEDPEASLFGNRWRAYSGQDEILMKNCAVWVARS